MGTSWVRPYKHIGWRARWLASLRSAHWKVSKNSKKNIWLYLYGASFGKLTSCAKRCRKRIPPSALGLIGKVWFFSFSKIIPSLVGSTQKKNFEVTHRDQRVANAKFGWDPSSSLGSKSEQTDRQTALFHIYIEELAIWARFAGPVNSVHLETIKIKFKKMHLPAPCFPKFINYPPFKFKF